MTNNSTSDVLLPATIREQFACLREGGSQPPLVYLDSASTALKPDGVIAALTDYYRNMPANIHRGLYPMSEAATAAFEAARATVQKFINARESREIIFTSGATDAINLVARGFGDGLRAGDEVLITGLEHHANIVPWQLLRERRGIVLRVVAMDAQGDVPLDAFRAALNGRTRLVAFTAISNALGTELPVAEMIESAHAVGATTVVDAAQAVACRRVDVQKWNCDFLAFSGHKLFGPTGIGVLYAREALLQAMPPVKGGGDMILSVTFERTTYNELPHKFEAGTPPIAQAIGLGVATEWVTALGFDQIEAHERVLVDAALKQLEALPGVQIIGRPGKRRSIISFTLDGIHPHDVGTILGEDGVAIRAGHHCAQPAMEHFGIPATIRASFSVYNTLADVKALIVGLRRVQEIML
ncbi:MAG: cysteine desulfurase [Kiritimatiellae bacterium]|jgi:cysteine desulfurase/selenocysteine lyase|nr:cysteine desulfurase [Kiritimatiellia bacterium]MDY0149846.1 cysteine desulfurase [Kiritimatiellia bacterium]